MKIAMIARSSLFLVRGGDTTQVVKTAEELNKLNIQADVYRASDKVPYENYDLLHFFNIIRPSDHLYHIRKSKKPYVLSTIYLDYSEFDRLGRGNYQAKLLGALGKFRSEYIKNLYRFYKKQDSMISPEYLLGHKRAMVIVLQGASLLLPNSHSEYRRLVKEMGPQTDYRVIPNGIDESLFQKIPENIIRQDKVICVAQIYGMKNQHSLIKACQKLNLPLEIIGKAPPNHVHYYDYCRKISAEKISFSDFMPQEELIEKYASAKVHALPSWFETTGLSSLEAGAMACSLVVGKGGDTLEYFKDLAFYCEANDQQSIVTALENAMNEPQNDKLRNMILSEYTWAKAAEASLKAYEFVLNEK